MELAQESIRTGKTFPMASWGKSPTLHWLIHSLLRLCLFHGRKGYVYITGLCGPTEKGLQSEAVGGHHPYLPYYTLCVPMGLPGFYLALSGFKTLAHKSSSSQIPNKRPITLLRAMTSAGHS